jgi:hypothetical protein
MVQPFVEHWTGSRRMFSVPCRRLKHPWLMARFGFSAPASARTIAHRFHNQRTQALPGWQRIHSSALTNH